jgi:hypothetical protein
LVVQNKGWDGSLAASREMMLMFMDVLEQKDWGLGKKDMLFGAVATYSTCEAANQRS